MNQNEKNEKIEGLRADILAVEKSIKNLESQVITIKTSIDEQDTVKNGLLLEIEKLQGNVKTLAISRESLQDTMSDYFGFGEISKVPETGEERITHYYSDDQSRGTSGPETATQKTLTMTKQAILEIDGSKEDITSTSLFYSESLVGPKADEIVKTYLMTFFLNHNQIIEYFNNACIQIRRVVGNNLKRKRARSTNTQEGKLIMVKFLYKQKMWQINIRPSRNG